MICASCRDGISPAKEGRVLKTEAFLLRIVVFMGDNSVINIKKTLNRDSYETVIQRVQHT